MLVKPEELNKIVMVASAGAYVYFGRKWGKKLDLQQI